MQTSESHLAAVSALVLERYGATQEQFDAKLGVTVDTVNRRKND
jgi:hypothetical protein